MKSLLLSIPALAAALAAWSLAGPVWAIPAALALLAAVAVVNDLTVRARRRAAAKTTRPAYGD